MPRAKLKHEIQAEPKGKLASRILAMPTDTNPMGHIFGGWIMANMDAAGKMTATEHAGGRVVTIAVSRIKFLSPVTVGDTVCCYTDVVRRGRTSITLGVEVWVLRQGQGDRLKVTEAEFTFVAIDENGRPRPIAPARDSERASEETIVRKKDERWSARTRARRRRRDIQRPSFSETESGS